MPNTVGHQETVFVGVPSMTVTADPGSYVGLTQDGVLMGAGTVDECGSLDVTFLDLLTPGVPMKMVVTAQNREPYIVGPERHRAGDRHDRSHGDRRERAYRHHGHDHGRRRDHSPARHQRLGRGPELHDHPGRDRRGGCRGDQRYWPPTGRPWTSSARTPPRPTACSPNRSRSTRWIWRRPDLTVTTDIGLIDAFALNLPGTLTATVAEKPATPWSRCMPDGTQYETADFSLIATPSQMGDVTGIIAVSGYNVYTETFPVIEAYGSVAGVVTTGGIPMANVVVNCLDEFGGNVFSVVTDAGGNYASPEDILVDDYTLVVDHFGYLHYEQAVFVNYGANILRHRPGRGSERHAYGYRHRGRHLRAPAGDREGLPHRHGRPLHRGPVRRERRLHHQRRCPTSTTKSRSAPGITCRRRSP